MANKSGEGKKAEKKIQMFLPKHKRCQGRYIRNV